MFINDYQKYKILMQYNIIFGFLLYLLPIFERFFTYMKRLFYLWIIFVGALFYLTAKAENLPIPKNFIRFSKCNTAVLLQRYSFNRFHSQNVSAGISYLIGLLQEFTLDGMRQKNFLSIGTEYLHHSFSFNSYYFYLDSVKLYDGKMDYTYHVKVNEITIPLLFKHNFSRENNDVHGIFYSIGYVYRIIIPGSITVSYNGLEQNYEKYRPHFKIGVMNKYSNSYVHMGIGYQKNNPMGKIKMYIECFGRYGFSPFLIKTDYTANSLFFGNYFVGISIGFKWRL